MKTVKKLIILLDTSCLLRTTLLHVVLLSIYITIWIAFPSLRISSVNSGIDCFIAMINLLLAILFSASVIAILMCLSVPVIKIVWFGIIQPAQSGWKKIVAWARQ